MIPNNVVELAKNTASLLELACKTTDDELVWNRLKDMNGDEARNVLYMILGYTSGVTLNLAEEEGKTIHEKMTELRELFVRTAEEVDLT